MPGTRALGRDKRKPNQSSSPTEMKYWIAMATKKQTETKLPHKIPQAMALGVATTTTTTTSTQVATPLLIVRVVTSLELIVFLGQNVDTSNSSSFRESYSKQLNF